MAVIVRRLVYALLLFAFTAPLPARAQQRDTAAARRLVEQRLGRSVTHAELVERLRQSGMSRSEVRNRLQQLGLDPGLADRYFDVIERGGEPPRGEAPSDLLGALQRLGISVRAVADSLTVPDSLQLDTLLMDTLAADTLERATLGELPIFGRSLFRRATTQFQPATLGPVDPGYRVGPGDEIALILTGDVELAYTLDVTREGYIVIPDAGQVFVNGLTLKELEQRLGTRLARVYSGVRGPNPTTSFQVSLGRLRTNQVYLIGEVVRPGAYQVSSVATAFNALYQAGGPAESGSFRRIEVKRGGKLYRTVDAYDYLLRGDSRDDVRLEQGDIVFVPTADRRVRVEGTVRRPAIYELSDKDGLRDLVRYAGGFQPEAFVRRIQIDRILPPDKRRPDVERVLIDVDIAQLEKGDFIPLQDGDLIQVFAVSKERRHRVTIVGQVRRPGVYEWVEGLSLWGLIERAQGLEEKAYTPRAHIYRLNDQDGNRELLRTALQLEAGGQPLNDITLADRDSIVVYSRERLRNPEAVAIDGFVKRPGSYVLAEGMTLKDLILASGGFIHGAYVLEAEVARLVDPLQRADTTARVIRIPLQETLPRTGANGEAVKAATDKVSALPLWPPGADEFPLRHGDHVFIRRAPGYEPARWIKITGEVLLPGRYVLETRQERLTDMLQRVGGLTAEAYAPGLKLIRKGDLVGTDLRRALKDPKSHYNLVLEPEDSLHVPPYDPTVLVTGAVAFGTRVLYNPGKGLEYYILQAGGYSDLADRDRVSITYPNGSRAAVRSFLFFDREPEPQPGSTVFVPAKPETALNKFDWDQFISRTLAILSTMATLIIAVQQLNN